MASLCLCFQVHQPFRLRRYSVFDTDRNYFDAQSNGDLCRRTAERTHVPANRLLLDAIRENDGRLRVAFSISGTSMELFRLYAPQVLDGFAELAATGCVEFLAGTSHHSLAFNYSREEFRAQVEAHRRLTVELFGQTPRVFHNTELIYNNDLAHFVSHMGYDAILAEGADQVLGVRSPNYVYRPPHAPRLKLLLRNYRLTDDITFRFGDRTWEQWPLTADKFAQWFGQANASGHASTLVMDYETLGVHHPAETGIFDFFRHLPRAVLGGSPDNAFRTPSEVAAAHEPVGEVDVPHMTSWADDARDLSPWVGNAMQSNAMGELYRLEGALRERGDADLLTDWRRLTSSNHFYYMCAKYWTDGDAHRHYSPYESPYDSYINFMNVLDNVQSRLRE